MAFEDMDTKHRAKEGGGRKEHKHANRTLVKGSEQRGWLPAGGWSHGGLTVLGYLSVCTQSFPLSSQRSQAERWEAAVVATFRSLFLEGCVPCRDGFTLTSRSVLQSLREPLLPPEGGTSGKPLQHRVQSCFQAKHRSLLLASSASAKPPVTG